MPRAFRGGLNKRMKAEYIYGDHDHPHCQGMFGGWLTEQGGLTFMVDCGVGGGGPGLAARLKERLGGRSLDYVLLTHIHLDHSGGLFDLFQAFPQAKAVAHAKGARHLIAPDMLWADTRRVMGELAATYGPARPVPAERLIPHNEAHIPGLVIHETPGHAPHHLSFELGDLIFVGEAAGDPFGFDGRVYGRPATPGRYFPVQVARSLEKLTALPDEPAYFGHNPEPLPLHASLEACRRQLTLWDSFLRPRSAFLPGEGGQERLERLTDELFAADPDLIAISENSGRNPWAERFFIRNSIAGFLAHYEAEAA